MSDNESDTGAESKHLRIIGHHSSYKRIVQSPTSNDQAVLYYHVTFDENNDENVEYWTATDLILDGYISNLNDYHNELMEEEKDEEDDEEEEEEKAEEKEFLVLVQQTDKNATFKVTNKLGEKIRFYTKRISSLTEKEIYHMNVEQTQTEKTREFGLYKTYQQKLKIKNPNVGVLCHIILYDAGRPLTVPEIRKIFKLRYPEKHKTITNQNTFAATLTKQEDNILKVRTNFYGILGRDKVDTDESSARTTRSKTSNKDSKKNDKGKK